MVEKRHFPVNDTLRKLGTPQTTLMSRPATSHFRLNLLCICLLVRTQGYFEINTCDFKLKVYCKRTVCYNTRKTKKVVKFLRL